MELKFIGQGYNRDAESSVAAELILELNKDTYHSFKCLVAFASHTGVSGLKQHIENSKSHINSFKIIVGVDQHGTSKEALEAIIDWNVDSFVFYTTQRIIFHPKIYLFEGDDIVTVIIGSNNLTQTGLAQNIEGSIKITYNKDETDESVLEQILSYYSPLLQSESPFLQRIDQNLIELLVSKGIVRTEAERRVQYRKDTQTENNASEPDSDYPAINDIFASVPLQRLPVGFNPIRRSFGTRTSSGIPDNTEEIQPTEDSENTYSSWSFTDSSEVLIAEIGGPSRWRQVNFPIQMFQNFFGATAGDNTYSINIKHVLEDGSLEFVENRQAVTVASSNYRFELGATSGLTYTSEPTRPLVMFIKASNNNFFYRLFMPTSEFYTEIREYLHNNYYGQRRFLKRIQTNVEEIKNQFENLPFWSVQ